MTQKQNPDAVSVNEAARWFGVTRQTLTQWLRDLDIPHGRGAVVSVPEIFKKKIEHEKRTAIEKALSSVVGEDGAELPIGQLSEKELKRQKMAVDLAIRRIDLDERSGKVVPIERVADRFGQQVAEVREGLYAIPDELAPDLLNQDSEVVVSDTIRAKIDEVLEALDKSAAGRLA